LTPDPTGELTLAQSIASHNAYIGAGLNCDGTNCGANLPQPFSIPMWAWIAGGGLLATILLRR
jgi:hypothetical protein